MRSTLNMADSRSIVRLSAAANTWQTPPNGCSLCLNTVFLVIGETVAEAFNRLFYFERAAETYIKALWTGQQLRVMSDDVATVTAQAIEDYPEQAERHFAELRAMLDQEASDYAT